MKTLFTSESKKVLFRTLPSAMFFLTVLLASLQVISQTTVHNETIPNQYNTGFAASVNGTFSGSTGAWNANSNAQATIVCTTPYYNPSTSYAIKIVNWNTSGKPAGDCKATSPTVNLSAYSSSPSVNLTFTLWTYTCVSGDNNAWVNVDFSSNGGTTWTNVWTRTSAQLFSAYGVNGKTNITIPVNTSYLTSNFRYRITGNMNANNPNNFYLFIDDIKIIANASCNPDDPTAGNGTSFCAPAPTCAAGNFLWSQSINQSNGTPSVVRLYYGSTTSYTIPSSSYPSAFSGPVTVTVSEVVSYDGYAGRSGVTQPNEKWRIVFKKAGATVYATPYTNDVADLKNQAYWKGTLGTATLLPNGTDAVVLEHYSVGTGDNSNPNSVVPVSVCINYTPVSCTCPNNLVQNPSFENGTTSWNWSGGTLNAGTGAVVCGTKSGDFQIANTSSNWVSQTIATNLPAGTTLNASVYAGTHDNSFYHQVAIDFFDANWNWISNAAVEVNKVLANSPVGPQLYTWSAVVPAGTKYTNVTFSGNGNWIKTDQWCVTATPPGSIGDRVWNDIDKDGIQDAGELGLAGVTVSLYNSSNNLIATTVTDAFGNYKFSNLPVSASGINYQVRFSLAPGYLFSTQNADAAGVTGPNNSDANTSTGRTGNITLTAASPNVTYVDAGMYLTEPSRIGDFIWNDLDMDGIQDPGEPGIAGVVVTLYDNAGNAVRVTVTDNNGYYEFKDVTPGTYSLGLSLPPGYMITVKDAGGDDNKDNDFDPVTTRTASFTVTTGVNLTLDGGLHVTDVTKASVGDYVWADLDNDNVQDSNEPGIAGVTVQLFNSANVLIATTVTNAFGYYIFNNVDPGAYYVKFSSLPAGYVFVTPDAGTDDTKDSDVTGANGTGTTATFNLLADQNNMTVDAGLRRTSALNSIGDYVWYDLDKDGIQDAGEAGVPGITVTLYNASTGAVVKTTTTNSSGLYMFTDVVSGSYTIGFSNLPAGYAFSPMDAGGDVVDSDVNPSTGRTATITIAGTGNVITTVDAGIVSNPNTFDSKASIGDFVWNDLNNNGIQDTGEPGVANITVTLYAADGTTVVATTTTDALGYYQFTNLNSGTYIVGFSGLPSGYVIGTRDAGSDDTKDSDPDPATGKTGPVTLLAGQINNSVDAAVRNTTVLARAGNFVWNDLNGDGHQNAGEPGVPGVSVFLLNSSGIVIANTVTDANGFYMFTDLAAGTYRIAFGNLPSGFVATTKDAAPANDNTDSDADAVTLTTDAFTLAAGAADMTRDFGIRSTTTASVGDYVWNDSNGNGIQDATESGVAGVLVTLYNSSGNPVASAVTDANGKYLFVNVTPGSYTIGFSSLPAGASFTVKDNGADNADSDVNPATGRTDVFTLAAGQSNLTIDAGLVTRYAAVGNYVWHDLNGDGIQDTDEPGVAGVTVILYNSANQPVASAVTDGNGYYFINNIPVPAGGASYTMGYTDIPTGMLFTVKNAAGSTQDDDSDANEDTGLTNAFTLNPGQIKLDIDAGLIKLINLSGNVWHDVNGMSDNLVNNTGAVQVPPASAIPVGLRMYLVNASTGLIERVTFVSSGTGTFSFSDIMPNTTYRLYLSQVIYPVGTPEASINALLPSGWEHTGQKNANPPNSPLGSDGINDGRVTVPGSTNDIINVNFGIRLSGGSVVIG